MKDEKPLIIGFILSAVFGVIPGVVFAASIYFSLAIATWVARTLWIIH